EPPPPATGRERAGAISPPAGFAVPIDGARDSLSGSNRRNIGEVPARPRGIDHSAVLKKGETLRRDGRLAADGRGRPRRRGSREHGGAKGKAEPWQAAAERSGDLCEEALERHALRTAD